MLDSTRTLNKKVREAEVAQYNFILVVGEKEKEVGAVNVRTHDNEVKGTMPLEECIKMFKNLEANYQ